MRRYVLIGTPKAADDWRVRAGIDETFVIRVTRPGELYRLTRTLAPRYTTFVSLRRGWALTEFDKDTIAAARCRGARYATAGS